jgi:hypothetical protein
LPCKMGRHGSVAPPAVPSCFASFVVPRAPLICLAISRLMRFANATVAAGSLSCAERQP